MKSLFTRFYLFVLISFLLGSFIGNYIQNLANKRGIARDYTIYGTNISSSIAREHSLGQDLEKLIGWWSKNLSNELREPLQLVDLQDSRFPQKSLESEAYTNTLEAGTLVDTLEVVVPTNPIIKRFQLKDLPQLKDKALVFHFVDEYSPEYKLMYYFGFIITFACLASSVYLATRIAYDYLQDLKQGLGEISNGNYQSRIRPNSIEAFQALSNDITTMAKSLEDHQRQEKIFNGAIGHELRTPITKLRLALDMLNDQQLPKDKRELAQDMDKYLDELNQLTELILNLSRARIQGSELSEESIDLSQLVNQLGQTLKLTQLQLDIEQQVFLTGHRPLYQLVLLNLVNNAEKYAEKTIRIQLRNTPQGVELIVEDDGIGLSEEQQQLIFQPFYRVDSSRSRDTGGFGLGLAIVAEIVKLSHGHIEAGRSPLGGASFMIRWPSS